MPPQQFSINVKVHGLIFVLLVFAFSREYIVWLYAAKWKFYIYLL